jgi:hypothetical protein
LGRSELPRTALRQNHVRRIGETLHLTEQHVSNRVIELDISLNLLDDVQSEAGLDYSAIRTRRAHTSPVKPEDQLLWVPVARLSKRSVSPVGVYDAHGALVPRLTQFESSKLLASGMYQLLRSILRAGTEVGELGRSVNQILTDSDEVRWLLQSALLTLFVERAGPTTPTPVAEPSGDRLPDRSSKQRGLAARVLKPEAGVLDDYYRLLNVALQEYLIIVGLPNSKDEHHLRYTVPMAAEHSVGGRAKSRLRQLAPGWRGYRVSYETKLPATVRSYHLVAETDPSLLVKQLVMTCDADRGTTARLVSDLSNLASRLANPPGSATDTGPRKILELELETAIRTLSEFVRRRTWEAQQAGGMLHPKRMKAVQIFAAAGVSDHAYPSRDGLHRASLFSNPQVTPERLTEACSELEAFGSKWDLTHQGDPLTHRAIAY